MRTDVNSLVTAAATTHLPEQHETSHMIQMLCTEAFSRAVQDCAHIRTEYCLAVPLTRSTAKPESLIKTMGTGISCAVDCNPLFRTTVQNKAGWADWDNVDNPKDPWERNGNKLIRQHPLPRRAAIASQHRRQVPNRTYKYCSL